jgi:superfamily I DNA/RNA helicase
VTVLIGGPLAGKTTRLITAFRQHLARGLRPENILCLSFFPANVAAIRAALRGSTGDYFPWVTTLQRFQTLLLRGYARQARLPRRAREISPTARGLLLRHAWQSVAGPLWLQFGTAPGAVRHLEAVANWLSQNRTRFVAAPQEFGDHELARVYQAYLRQCDAQRLLTFQEASLRCLDLLSDPDIAADVRRRFPVVLVDDLHLARPDQLALIERLRDLAQHFLATAWLPEAGEPAAPELLRVAETISQWGASEPLPLHSGVNPAVRELARRLAAPPAANPVPVGGHPVRLHVAFTVEDEAHAAVQAIVRALVNDPTLQPSDVALVAADASVLPFVQRVLAEYGLPAPAPALSARRTPLILGGLLALRRTLLGPEAAVDRELFTLPYLALDPLDQHTLTSEAAILQQPILALPPETLSRLGLQLATHERLALVHQILASLDPALPLPDLVEQALTGLGAFTWLRAAPAPADTFSPDERNGWERAFLEWNDRLRELQSVAGLGPMRPADLLALSETLADEISLPTPPAGVQLVAPGRANGVQARLALVVGLSENAAPRRRPARQLLAESELPALFAAGRPVILPLARQPAAWIEREARALAELLTRGTEQLWLSTSRYTAAGEAQLPSPFFERLLGADGEIDRDGGLVITRPGLWQLVTAAPLAGPEHPLPTLSLGPASAPAADPTAAVLTDHTFSASQVRLYLTCPLQFFYARVLGLEAEGALALDRGGLLHEVLCATLGDGRLQAVNLQHRPRPVWMNAVGPLRERARLMLDAAWTGQPASLPGGRYQPAQAWGERFGPALQRQAVRRWAEALVDSWAEYEVDGWPDALQRRPLLLEMPFTFELGGHRLTGRLDRVDEIQTPAGVVYDIVDYKASRSAKDSLAVQIARFLPPEGAAPSDYQLPLYALALTHGLPGVQAPPARLSLLNVDGLDKNKNGSYKAAACRTITLGPAGALNLKTGYVPLSLIQADVTNSLVAILGRMSASPYPARPDRHCDYCSFRTACERSQGQETL